MIHKSFVPTVQVSWLWGHQLGVLAELGSYPFPFQLSELLTTSAIRIFAKRSQYYSDSNTATWIICESYCHDILPPFLRIFWLNLEVITAFYYVQDSYQLQSSKFSPRLGKKSNLKAIISKSWTSHCYLLFVFAAFSLTQEVVPPVR